MSRVKGCVLKVTGSLVTTEPVHVGSSRLDLETDLPLAIDGQHRPYVPGTSIAGPLRAWMFDTFPDVDAVAALWGDANNLGASRLIVDDAYMTTEQEVWDAVGIDRETGVAASRAKFDRAVLPANSKLMLVMEVELPIDQALLASCRSLVGRLLQALKDEQIGLGGGRTRGFGLMKLDGVEIVEEDWSSRTKVLEWLEKGGGKTLTPSDLIKAAALVPRVPARVDIDITWEPAGPVMVKAGRDGLAVDMLPMVSGTGGHVGMVISGSSIKGALRSQAERTVRTVTGAPLPLVPDDGLKRHRKHIDVPLVRSIFGGPRAQTSGADAVDKPGNGSMVVAPAKGALTVGPCFAQSLQATWSKWQDVAIAADQLQLNESVKALDGEFEVSSPPAPNLQAAQHVGIDRWTGAAADRILFSGVEPFHVEWTPMKLRLELRRIDESERDAAVAMMLLLVRDLVRHRIGIGFGHNRGYGEVSVKAATVTLRGGDDAKPYGWLGRQNLTDLTTLDVAKVRDLEMAWRRWIDTQQPIASDEVQL